VRKRRSLWRRIRWPSVAIAFAGVMLFGSVVMLRGSPAHGPILAHPPPGIEARQIPLPPGEWREVGRVTQEREAAVVLMRVHGRDVDAAVLARVNRLGQRVAWGLPPPCLSTDYEPRRVVYASDHDGACVYASFVDGTGPLTGVTIDPAWRSAIQEAVDRGWNVPTTWLSATFRVVDPLDGLQLRYLFHPWPVEDTRPPESAAWRRIQSERLGTWIEAAVPVVSLAYRGRFRDWKDAALPDPALIDTSVRIAPPEEPVSQPYSLRGITARVAALLSDFGVLWAFTGNPVTASAVAGAKFAAQGATGLTHEAVWSWLLSSSAPTDLPGAGVETPLPQ